MQKYEYTIDDNTIQVISHEQELKVYDFGNWESEKILHYKSLLAHKKDMEYAKEYLNQMFFQKDSSLIDGALINSAIQLLVKCFTSSKGEI